MTPSAGLLPSYIQALETGWAFDAFWFGSTAAALRLARHDPERFLEVLTVGAGPSPTLTLPDGQVVPRLPSQVRWMWDGAFAGSINLRWQEGTVDLPPHVLGHIGYGTVADRRSRGYATAALAAMLPLAWAQGLPFVDLVTSVANTASQGVITRNGGVRVDAFDHPTDPDGGRMIRWRIPR